MLNNSPNSNPDFTELLICPLCNALCIEGKTISSEALAELCDRVAGSGKNTVVFLIGSSWGLHERIKGMCDLRLSFSPMTFPHSLFKVMLAEQIYRAAGILAGNQYHK